MPELTCTARRTGDFESRTEEYELTFAFAGAGPRPLKVKYLASRAYEINAALDAAAETARQTIAEVDPALAARPGDEALQQLAWRTMQAAKYEEGTPQTTRLEL
ncbi:MAG: hypothetical protein AB1425_05975 [Actinomycetota bacterium]